MKTQGGAPEIGSALSGREKEEFQALWAKMEARRLGPPPSVHHSELPAWPDSEPEGRDYELVRREVAGWLDRACMGRSGR